MTTLTMRLVKGDFIVTGPDVEPMKFKSRARGQGLVQDAPSRLADHRGRSRRQARGTQETIRAAEPVTRVVLSKMQNSRKAIIAANARGRHPKVLLNSKLPCLCREQD